jgi:hypothetical protein
MLGCLHHASGPEEELGAVHTLGFSDCDSTIFLQEEGDRAKGEGGKRVESAKVLRILSI